MAKRPDLGDFLTQLELGKLKAIKSQDPKTVGSYVDKIIQRYEQNKPLLTRILQKLVYSTTLAYIKGDKKLFIYDPLQFLAEDPVLDQFIDLHDHEDNLTGIAVLNALEFRELGRPEVLPHYLACALEHGQVIRALSPLTRDNLFYFATHVSAHRKIGVVTVGGDAFQHNFPLYLDHFRRAEQEILPSFAPDVHALPPFHLADMIAPPGYYFEDHPIVFLDKEKARQRSRAQKTLGLIGRAFDEYCKHSSKKEDTHSFFSTFQRVLAQEDNPNAFIDASTEIRFPRIASLTTYEDFQRLLANSKLQPVDRSTILATLIPLLDDISVRESRTVKEAVSRLRNTLEKNLCTTVDEVQETLAFDVSGYRLVKKLGEGGSRKVYLADRVIGERVSRVPRKIKIFKADKEELHTKIAAMRDRRDVEDVVFYECDVLATLSHPNLIRYFEHGTCSDLRFRTHHGETEQVSQLEDFMAPEEGVERFFTVSQYVEGSSLDARLQDLDPHNLGSIFKQIAAGLSYLHQSGYLHRDLKLRNILADHDFSEVVLDDLETVTELGELIRLQNRVTIGSDYYAAPELLQGAPASIASDIYAFGACLYYMLTEETTSLAQINGLPREAYERSYRTFMRDRIKIAQGITQDKEPQFYAPIERLFEEDLDDFTREHIQLRIQRTTAHYQPPPNEPVPYHILFARVLSRALNYDPSQRYSSVVEMKGDINHTIDLLEVIVPEDESDKQPWEPSFLGDDIGFLTDITKK